MRHCVGFLVCALAVASFLLGDNTVAASADQRRAVQRKRKLQPLKKAGDVISPCTDPGVPYTLQKYSNSSGRYLEVTIAVSHNPLEQKSPGPPDGRETTPPFNITCGVILPARFPPLSKSGAPPVIPTILAFSGGPQQLFNWDDWAARFFDPSIKAGLANDWIIISPIAPQHLGVTFFTSTGAGFVPAIFDAVQTLLGFRAEGGRFHCVGNSNGGVSCFEAALSAPHLFASITAHTGFSMAALKLTNEAAVEALRPLATIPIVMHVGDLDCFRFHKSMARTVEVLQELGHPDATFHEYPGVGHFNVVSDMIADVPSGRLHAGWDWLERHRRPKILHSKSNAHSEL